MDDHPYARCYNFAIGPEDLQALLLAPPVLPPQWWLTDLNALAGHDPLLATICLVLRAMAYGLIPSPLPEGGL